MQIKIKLIASPLYVMTCVTTDKQSGIDLLTKLIEEIKTAILAKGCVRACMRNCACVTVHICSQASYIRLCPRFARLLLVSITH